MLKLTKKADYGLIALRHLAVARPRASASAKDIADSYGIPLPLLSKVLQKLARGGLLISEQGTNGGYRLSREARDISALEAIRVIDGPIILTKCFTEHAGCDQTALCPVREPSAPTSVLVHARQGDDGPAVRTSDWLSQPDVESSRSTHRRRCGVPASACALLSGLYHL